MPMLWMKKYIVEISGELVSISIVDLVEMSFEEIVGIFFGELVGEFESCFECRLKNLRNFVLTWYDLFYCRITLFCFFVLLKHIFKSSNTFWIEHLYSYIYDFVDWFENCVPFSLISAIYHAYQYLFVGEYVITTSQRMCSVCIYLVTVVTRSTL